MLYWLKQSGLVLLITGNWVVEPKFFGISTPINLTLFQLKGAQKVFDYLLWGFIDLSGEWVVEPKHAYIGSYNEKCDVVFVCPEERGSLSSYKFKEEFVSMHASPIFLLNFQMKAAMQDLQTEKPQKSRYVSLQWTLRVGMSIKFYVLSNRKPVSLLGLFVGIVALACWEL